MASQYEEVADLKTRTLKITIEYDASTKDDPLEWNWRVMLYLDPDFENVIVEPFEPFED